MRWPLPSEKTIRHPHKDYQKLLSECWDEPQLQKTDVYYPSEEKVFALWKDEIESGRLERFVWILHYKLSKTKLIEVLKTDAKRERIYDEFSRAEFNYLDLEDYLYGGDARNEILDFIETRKTRE